MNNKGQSLIIFVLILPIITLFLAFFIDSSLSIMEKNKIDGVITSNIENAINNGIDDIDKLKEAIKKNVDVSIDIQVISDALIINAKTIRKSVFAKILDLPWYNLEFNYCGNYFSKKINKNCK